MHGPTMPLVPIMPISGRKQVHAAAAAVRAAGRSPVQFGDELRGGTPLARAWPWPRCVLKTASSRPQMGTDADGDRFLADIGVAGAVDQAALMRFRQSLLAVTDQLHLRDRATSRLGGAFCHE